METSQDPVSYDHPQLNRSSHSGVGSNWYELLPLCLCSDTDFVTGSNGANLSFAIALGIPDDDEHCLPLGGNALCEKNAWLVGMVNSMPYIAICLL